MLRRTIKKLRRLLPKFTRRQDGAVAVEFALLGVPFFALFLVAGETAAVIFTDVALQNGTIETARLIRTGQVQTQGISSGQFKNVLCGNIASYITCSKIHVYVYKSASLPIGGIDLMTADSNTPQSFTPGAASEWVMVQVYYDWELVVPGISQLANHGDNTRRLTAGTMFRNEPFGG